MKASSDFDFPERLGHDEGLGGLTDRSFGLFISVFLALVAIAPLTRSESIRLWAVTLAAAFLVISLTKPAMLGPANQMWRRLGQLLQKLMNLIVMTVLYYSTVVPFAFTMRLLSRNPLRLKWDPCQTSYWIPRKPPGPRPESMKDQF